MAIKISGSTIIDDSRNIVNAGVVTATSFDSGGISSQFVKGDGSLDSNSYTSTGKAIAMAMVFG